jgi:hypothetical protein
MLRAHPLLYRRHVPTEIALMRPGKHPCSSRSSPQPPVYTTESTSSPRRFPSLPSQPPTKNIFSRRVVYAFDSRPHASHGCIILVRYYFRITWTGKRPIYWQQDRAIDEGKVRRPVLSLTILFRHPLSLPQSSPPRRQSCRQREHVRRKLRF